MNFGVLDAVALYIWTADMECYSKWQFITYKIDA